MVETLDARVRNANVLLMENTPPKDPFTMFRDMVTQWENAANDWGNKVMATPEAVQAMQMGTAASLKMQEATNESMAKALAAANMPSKADVEALGTRLVAVEAQLSRIEAMLTGSTASGTAMPAPRPKRTRMPPAKAK
jgi:hypothetical protein